MWVTTYLRTFLSLKKLFFLPLVMFSVRFVCLSVSRITQKLPGRFFYFFLFIYFFMQIHPLVEGCSTGQGKIHFGAVLNEGPDPDFFPTFFNVVK